MEYFISKPIHLCYNINIITYKSEQSGEETKYEK